MTVEYHYNSDDRLIDICCVGELTIEEILQYFEDLKNDVSVKDGAIEMVDLTRVVFFNVNFRDAARMPSGYIPAQEFKGIRATILFGTNPLNEGLAELIKVHFEHSMPQHVFLVVATREEALQRAARMHRELDRGIS